MEDKVMDLVYFISKAHFYHDIKDHLIDICKRNGIFARKPRYNFSVIHRWKPNCAIGLMKEPENNVFRKKIEIIIKPDHSNHRIMRSVIMIGDRIIHKVENLDHPEWNNKKVFLQELHALERDIGIILEKIKQEA